MFYSYTFSLAVSISVQYISTQGLASIFKEKIEKMTKIARRDMKVERTNHRLFSSSQTTLSTGKGRTATNEGG